MLPRFSFDCIRHKLTTFRQGHIVRVWSVWCPKAHVHEKWLIKGLESHLLKCFWVSRIRLFSTQNLFSSAFLASPTLFTGLNFSTCSLINFFAVSLNVKSVSDESKPRCVFAGFVLLINLKFGEFRPSSRSRMSRAACRARAASFLVAKEMPPAPNS